MKINLFRISIIVVYTHATHSANEEVATFYCVLDNAKAPCTSQEIKIFYWNLKSKVCKGGIVVKFGLETHNKHGEKWTQSCTSNDEGVTNIWLQEHRGSMWTCGSPGEDTKNQIDYVAINMKFKNVILYWKKHTQVPIARATTFQWNVSRVKLPTLNRAKILKPHTIHKVRQKTH